MEKGRWRIRADLARTDPSFLARLVALEDARFFDHPGVDPLATLRAAAAAAALLHGRITSGASTLTMQTARLLEPRPRNFAAKLFQMARALQLQARFSTADAGDVPDPRALRRQRRGRGRGQPRLFPATVLESLTLGEQALLIALPQSPEARRPDRHPDRARQAREWVLRRMSRAGLISRPAAEEAAAEPLLPRQPFRSLAWHAAGELARAAPFGEATVVSTLDADLQRRLEPLAAATAAAQGADAEAAILVIEAKSWAVRAAVGSAGLTAPSGWMDMTRALRSPGSALKPFIYGLALDDGIVAPDTQINDAPRRFSTTSRRTSTASSTAW